MESAEDKNYAAVQRLEGLLAAPRANPSSTSETEAIREVGFEIAIAIREVGAMQINVGWEQAFAANRRSARGDPDSER